MRYLARDDDGTFFNVWPESRRRLLTSEISGWSDCPVVEVDVRERVAADPAPSRELREPDYHGWLETGASEYDFVWPSRGQVEICFPDIREAIRRGEGRLVALVVRRARRT